jgi:ligand-binding sensor domain-containing protein
MNKLNTSRFSAYVFLLLIFSAHTIFSFSQFTNYNSAIQINDILVDNASVWAASTGGLIQVDLVKDTAFLESDVDNIPDLFLTALCKDNKGNVWIGSKKGYLVKRDTRKRFRVIF